MSNVKVTVTFKREECDDNNPDLSWLEQTDAQMGEGFEAQSTKRLAEYNRGDWHMIGIRAVATIQVERGNFTTCYELSSPGLWGIESDSEQSYLESVFKDECSVLQADIEAMKTAEFKL